MHDTKHKEKKKHERRNKSMLNKKVEKALNDQINAELWSGYLYLSMAAYCENKNLVGFAHWLAVQAKEELNHAMRIYRHVIDCSGRATLAPIDKVPTTWKSPLDIFEAAYNHEVKVTGLINTLTDIAMKEGDYATTNMLHWFHNEQIEEEAQTQLIAAKLKLIGTSGPSLLMLDHELGKREK